MAREVYKIDRSRQIKTLYDHVILFLIFGVLISIIFT